MLVVEQCIRATPGISGVQVVEAVQAVDAKIVERTVRTCLRRLRLAKKIWKRGKLWYPKSEQSSEGEELLPLAA